MAALLTRTLRTLLSRALLLAGLLAACAPGKEVYQVRGVVLGADAEHAQLTVEHEEISGFMPAMTMNFDVSPAVDVATLEPGMRIAFELERTGSSLRILTVQVIGRQEVASGRSGIAAAPAEAQPAPEIELTDQDGRRFSLRELRGSAVLLDFIFTRCAGPCPILTARQAELQRSLAPELRACTRFASVSVDPEHDQPHVLREYARARGADLRDWWFLTGEPQAVAQVLSTYGVAAVRSDDERNIEHLVATYLIDAQGNIAQRYLGLSTEPDAIRRDLASACG